MPHIAKLDTAGARSPVGPGRTPTTSRRAVIEEQSTRRDEPAGAPGARPASTTLRALAERVRGAPARRTLLVCRRRAHGRELRRSLAVRGLGWAGLEPVTPIDVAREIAGPALASRGRRSAGELERRGLLEELLDRALEAAPGSGPDRLAEKAGFRDAAAGAVEALRLAGVSGARVRREAGGSGSGTEEGGRLVLVAELLERYERALRERGWADPATELRAAQEGLRADRLHPPDARTLLLPGQSTRGLRGRLLQELRGCGAELLPAEPLHGRAPPERLLWTTPERGEKGERASRLSWLHAPGGTDGGTGGERAAADPAAGSSLPPDPGIELFAAAGPREEIREALRRARATGRRWDEVEIVATDAVAYGCALDSLARRLDVPVTYAVGLPVERTRPGRAAAAYFRWIEEDFPARILCRLLRSGALQPRVPGGEAPDGARLARLLRRLRVGWGRDRYLERLDGRRRELGRDPSPRRAGAPGESPGGEEPADARERERRRQRELRELRALRRLLEPVLEATPAVPDRVAPGSPRVSPAELARGLRTFLDFAPDEEEREREALEDLRDRLRRVEETLDRTSSFAAALSVLRAQLEVRVAPADAEGEGTRPWSSTGGCVHFTDLEHGGWTGRPLTFVVGLDADRFPGSDLQHPLLPDTLRRRLDAGLPTAADRVRETRHRLDRLLARLRGRAVLSYSAWSSAEGRGVAPASVLLQALRLREEDPSIDFGDLHRHLGPPASPVPRASPPLDATDSWLAALAGEDDGGAGDDDAPGPLLLRGTGTVRAAFPRLDRGLRARAARRSPEAGPHRGRIRPRPARLDPRETGELLSASRLERLGRCPLAYFYRDVLGLRAPEEPEFDPSRWLDPRERGALLHRVYESTLRRAGSREDVPDAGELEELAAEALEEEARRARRRVPPPSDFVYRLELRRLREDVATFASMAAEDVPAPAALERDFGFSGAEHPEAELEVPGGRLRYGGRMDRVDRREDGRLRVVDYKTGRPAGRGGGGDPFDGGRRFQHLLYSRAAESIFGRPVARFEYQYPTVRGEAERVAYGDEQLAAGPERLGRLLDMVREGTFLPTDEARDCRFCDYRPVCRVTEDAYGNVDSPPARWADEHARDLEAYAPLRSVREAE